MKKVVLLVLLSISLSCDDGDLTIETIDFDDASIMFCESSTTIDSDLFFKLNSTESLILKLQSGILKNEVSEDTIVSSVPSQSQITYRTFSGTVSKDYFCDDIPPLDPVVLQELEAEGGSVKIFTTQSETDTTVFEHNIRLSAISLVNEKGERLTDLRINNFGTITTQE
ncbi:hypothetical protein [Eudoraea chungangensis]|uniref:hypothetical protein n=1 Tax=Eudoraea chungangensis TaxID=1481905 RepID=UPI0023EC92DC|nr:hypothetical protein [Eudoraea chungangensis]